jgi:chorismate synthase
MSANSFGRIFRFTSFGESHGEAMGVIIDGCPSGIPCDSALFNQALQRRRPGDHAGTSQRRELDQVRILSGLHQGKTTGSPIAVLVPNIDVQSAAYKKQAALLRPGHGQFTYEQKYGKVDLRGGGRASARETLCRVIAGALAQTVLQRQGVSLYAFLVQLAELRHPGSAQDWAKSMPKVDKSQLYCFDQSIQAAMLQRIRELQSSGDSVGGKVFFAAKGLPIGLGAPLYQKMEAELAYAMLSIPASKSFEIGAGLAAVSMTGSQHNDGFVADADGIRPSSNHAGGVLAGITTGMPLYGEVGFKPTSSIRIAQDTVDHSGKAAQWSWAENKRHDPCVAIRAVPVVEAMLACVLLDQWLLAQTVHIKDLQCENADL